ncbi:MAG: hypothetical protein IMW91_10575, partial [Firmicutes bacterium]|nr:hypothetical protein [Bacillota bacterium]
VAVARADRLGQATDPPQVVEADIQTMIARISEALAPVGPAETFRLAIGGKEVMQRLGIGPGPLVGRWLAYLQEWVVEHPDQNRQEILLQLIDPSQPEPPAKDKVEPPTA